MPRTIASRSATRTLHRPSSTKANGSSLARSPGRRVVLLTTFRKTRMHEADQVARAVAARRVCADEHGPAHVTYSRAEEGDAR